MTTPPAPATAPAPSASPASVPAPSPRLEEITPGNLDAALGIRVHPAQEHAVAPVVKSLAEAYVHPGTAWPRLITDGGRPVGFLMAFLDIDWHLDGSVIRSGLWRLNIAAGEQGRGYGRFAVHAVAAELRRRGATRMYVSWHPGPDGPERFYLRLGFRPNGETSGGQTVGVLDLAREPAGPEAPGTAPSA
ncbi:GNAT family N-acetyltransferase [Streptomyces sp. NRRL S-340]|uniref:GNAT family N-acetyltransferase n=1 Tax=Streptomyces sp. NRRL S-340 TaxID=1463901 RepID=UPI00099C4885|nr:GNAT family N-acetyltransferase [Streptomyces sp. NRRL S-340]